MFDLFDLPDAKRVRREDLFSSPSSSRPSSPTPGDNTPPSKETEAALNARLARLVALAIPPLPKDNDAPMPDALEEKEEEFEFRLFSTSAPTQHINLAEEVHQGPAISQRPVEFYVRGELTEEEKARFRAAAVSGEDVVRGAKGRAWGLEVPWRVVRVVAGGGGKKGQRGQAGKGEGDGKGDGKGMGESGGEGEAKGRKRPGKKRRIALRIKVKAAKEEEAKKMSKEEHLKEKKKRLNREKKLKRRQKEKEKKMAMGLGGGEGDVSSDDGSE